MRKRFREIKKQFWFNKEEALELSEKARRTDLTEAELVRMLVRGYEPREAPSNDLEKFVVQLRLIGNNLNQIAKKAHEFGFIDVLLYKRETEKLNKFMEDVKDEFIRPKKANN